MIPHMEEALAGYLSPGITSSLKKLVLPTRPCRITYSLVGKAPPRPVLARSTSGPEGEHGELCEWVAVLFKGASGRPDFRNVISSNKRS